MAGVEIHRLKAGDKFKLGTGEEITIPPEDVNDSAQVLVLDRAPVPTRMLKHQGNWLVDPFPMIEARKAAAKVRQGK